MRRYHDEMRVMHDLKTFTALDLSNALECPFGTAGSILAQLAQKGFVDRIRVSYSFLYTLSEKGKKVVARLPAIDPQERVLQLEYVSGLVDSPMVPDCPYCGTTGLLQSWCGNDGTAYGKWKCPECGDVHQYVDAYDDLPF
jgi:hypothetical protein